VWTDEVSPGIGLRAYLGTTQYSEKFLQGDTQPTATLGLQMLVPDGEVYRVNVYGNAAIAGWTEQQIE